MLKRLRIRNYKCLRDLTLDIPAFNVIVGKNDTGKTSFLEAVHHLAQFVGPRPPQLGGAWSVKNLITHDAVESSLSWEAQIDARSSQTEGVADVSYRLEVGPHLDSESSSRIVDECLHAPAEDLFVKRVTVPPPPIPVHPRPDPLTEVSDGQSRARLGASGQTALAWIRDQPGFARLKQVSHGLSSTRLYRLDPRVLGTPAIFKTGPNNKVLEPRLSRDGDGLPLVLDLMSGAQRAAFDEVERELRSFSPNIRSIALRTQALEGGLGKTLSFVLADGREAPAGLMSDGVLLFLTFLTLVHGPSTPSIVLVEEPENGMHPHALKQVVSVLKRLTDPNRVARPIQVMLTTHSPYLLDFVPPESVAIFGRNESGDCTAKRLVEIPGVMDRLAAGFSLGEMWFNTGEDQLLSLGSK